MKKYIVTITNQIEIFNIVGISENGLFHVIKAYYNENRNVKFGGKTFPLKGIKEITIHKFENEESLNTFFKHVIDNNLKKRSITGDYYYDLETIEQFSKNVTIDYLSPEKDFNQTNSSNKESQDILKAVDEIINRLAKLELGQQVIYDDLKDDIEEVKELIGKISKKNLRQLIIGKLVDAGLGSLTSEVVGVIKEIDIKKLL